MKLIKISILLLILTSTSCQNNTSKSISDATKDEIKYAVGLSIRVEDDYTVVTVKNPWPNAKELFKYVLYKKEIVVPDSLKKYTQIQVPVKNLVATSTTHIPSIEMLNQENKLIGFPNLDYISSTKIRTLIDQKKIKELGNNQSLNTELLLELQPSVIIGYGLDNSNPTLENLKRNGLKVVLNGDWNEQTPLGKAEWIKLFGALFDQQKEANQIFEHIENEYQKTLELVKKSKNKPTILAGSTFEGKWYLPQGESWGAQFLSNAGGNYLWKKTKGTGSISLSFEEVYEKAKEADFWIGPGQFTSLHELAITNSHFTQFKAFKTKNIYSFSTKKGKTGGVIYYELAPNRPDLVLKDLVKILHPELLPNYQLYFFEQLK